MKELEQFLTGFLFRIVNNRCQFESFANILHSVEHAGKVLVVFLTGFTFLLLFVTSFVDALSMYATIVAVSVYFFGGSTLSRLQNGIMLVFAIRPFRVGDGILIDGQRFNVKQMGLFSTWMTDRLGNMHVWNNSELLNKTNSLINLSQTKDCKHKLTFYIDQDVSDKQLEEFEKVFKRHVENDKKTKFVCGNIQVIENGFDEYMRSKIELLIESRISFVDSRLRFEIENRLYRLMRKAMKSKNCKIRTKMMDINICGLRANTTIDNYNVIGTDTDDDDTDDDGNDDDDHNDIKNVNGKVPVQRGPGTNRKQNIKYNKAPGSGSDVDMIGLNIAKQAKENLDMVDEDEEVEAKDHMSHVNANTNIDKNTNKNNNKNKNVSFNVTTNNIGDDTSIASVKNTHIEMTERDCSGDCKENKPHFVKSEKKLMTQEQSVKGKPNVNIGDEQNQCASSEHVMVEREPLVTSVAPSGGMDRLRIQISQAKQN